MHDTAMIFGEAFFKTYLHDRLNLTIVDVGSQDVNGTLRSVAPLHNKYIGVDFIEAKGVDIVINDPYKLPFDDQSVDILVSSSCFEHSEFFWLLFNECLRVLKPEGLLYLNAPSNGSFHRYPLDCWRFYPDSGIALQNWGRRSGYECLLLESFIGLQNNHLWNDFVAIFLKDKSHSAAYPYRIQEHLNSFMNGRKFDSKELTNYVEFTEDQLKIKKLSSIVHSIKQMLNKQLP